jgi:GxxExxY protein
MWSWCRKSRRKKLHKQEETEITENIFQQTLCSLCCLLFIPDDEKENSKNSQQERTEKTEFFKINLCYLRCLLFKPVPSVVSCLFQRFMHPLFESASRLTEAIIGAAIEVHRNKGPGLIESIYEWCLLKELELRGLSTMSQKVVVVEYKGFTREEPLRFDVLVEGCVLVEAKAVQQILPVHKAQLLSYMKLLDVPLGLLINFHELKLTDGVARLILPGANR